ncbi:Metallo-dependent phosphatase-like protein [Pilobolus umbonatus]|nr:Metallo-dependent phosphatase-like protein [Pilobolus umbonatus]
MVIVVIVHAGDITRASTYHEYERTIQWMSTLPHKVKVITGGNHDHILDNHKYNYTKQKERVIQLMKDHHIDYVEHDLYQLPDSLGAYTLFISPYSPIHYGGAFMLGDLGPIWDTIPDTPIDILVTHTPPRNRQDRTRRGHHVGCPLLLDKIENVIKPKVSVFGHIHEAHGYCYVNDILYINASICDHRYKGRQTPITFDL